MKNSSVITCLLGALISLGALSACHSENKKPKTQFEIQLESFKDGKRDVDFLHSLIAGFDTIQSEQELSAVKMEVIDALLCTHPIPERYSGDNLTLFENAIHDFQLQSYVDLVNNWAELKSTGIDSLITAKVSNDGGTYAKDFLTHYIETMEMRDADFQLALKAYHTLGIADKKTDELIFQMLDEATKHQIGKMIEIIEANYIGINYYPSSYIEMFLYNGCLRIVLDLCDKQQCDDMLALLNSLDPKVAKTRYKRTIDDFTGKKMYIKYYEEHK